MRVACLGGGPAGLYVAISMKLRGPSHEVVVIERNKASDTFGRGVVLSARRGRPDPPLAMELATSGITVNAVCPGFVETPLLERSIASIVDKTGTTGDAAREARLAGTPQRRFVRADEVAGAVLWPTGDAARSVNGHMLTLSGGET